MLSIKHKQRLNTWLEEARNGFNLQSRGIKYHWPKQTDQQQQRISLTNFPLLIGADVHWDKQGLCRFKLAINSQHSPYLRHHSFPMGDIMPATVILEYFIEAACWLQQSNQDQLQWHPLQVSQLKLDRVLVLPPGNDSIALEIQVDKRFIGPRGHETHLSLHSPRFNKQGKFLGLKCHASAIISFDAQVRAAHKVPLLHGQIQHYQTSQEDIYRKVMTSHGELLQSLSGDFYINQQRDQILAQYHCANKEFAWLASGNGLFILSPLGLDSCLQLLCLLAILQDGQPRLPMAISQLNLYQPHPSNQPCRALIELVYQDAGKTHAKITVFDPLNRIIFEVKQAVAQSHPGNPFDVARFEHWLETIAERSAKEESHAPL